MSWRHLTGVRRQREVGQKGVAVRTAETACRVPTWSCLKRPVVAARDIVKRARKLIKLWIDKSYPGQVLRLKRFVDSRKKAGVQRRDCARSPDHLHGAIDKNIVASLRIRIAADIWHAAPTIRILRRRHICIRLVVGQRKYITHAATRRTKSLGFLIPDGLRYDPRIIR